MDALVISENLREISIAVFFFTVTETYYKNYKCARESRCDPFANLKVTPLQVTSAKV